jgi:hypothetical protein
MMMTIEQKFLAKLWQGFLFLALLSFIITTGRLCAVLASDTPPGFGAPPEKTSVQGSRHKKNILILFPYQVDLPHTVLASNAISDELDHAIDMDIELYFEYMDVNRFADVSYRSSLVGLYAAKYGNKTIDLALVASEEALDFWLAHSAQILPGTPTVFFDVNEGKLSGRRFPPNVTGVGAVNDCTESVLWMMNIRPVVDEIILVHGVGNADKVLYSPVEALKKDLAGKVKLSDWSDFPLSKIKQRAAGLPRTAVIFYYLMFEDSAGLKYRPIDVASQLGRVSAVPVLSAYDQFIGTGTIGGYMYSIEKNARIATRMGLRILRGEEASALPVLTGIHNVFIFDHPALKRYNIPLSSLPPGSIIKNRQNSPWEEYRLQISGIIAGFSVLVLVVFVLAGLNRKLKLARLNLRQLNAGLETQVQERTAALSQSNRNLEAEIIERVQAEKNLGRTIDELQGALAKIKQLEGILPICSYCKKIRNEENRWQNVEAYISNHSIAEFSHTFCPECCRKHYPEYFSESTEE